MPHRKVNSLRDLHRLRLKDDVVQITKAGTHYKARWPGGANFVFAPNPKEAEERLRSVSDRYRNDHRNDRARQTNYWIGDKQ